MSLQLSDRINAIQPSATIAMNVKAKALAAEGISVINLSVGEPDFDTPTFIQEAAITAMQAGQTRYTAADGSPAAEAQSTAQPETRPEAQPEAQPETRPGRPKSAVLIVDDEKFIREITGELVRKAGAELVETASDGEEGPQIVPIAERLALSPRD